MEYSPILKQQAISPCRQIENYLNSDFQNDTRPRRVEVNVPLAMAIQKHLRRYAESWMEANFRIEHWSLRERLETDINRQRIRMFQASPGPLLMKVEGKTIPVEPLDQKPFVTPSWDFLDLTIGPEEFDENHELEGRKRAARLFFEFITGPFWHRLKVCGRCRRFFINTSG